VIVGKKDRREAWEIEADQRFNRAKHRIPPVPTQSAAALTNTDEVPPTASKKVEKEAWEIEAEQGLLTEGGRRRARAEAARKAEAELQSKDNSLTPSSPSHSSSLLTDPQYYDAGTRTLTLPSVTASKVIKQHGRAFSFAAPSGVTEGSDSNLAIPTATLPLALIVIQPFAETLKALICNSRRKERAVTLPSSEVSPLLPKVTNLEFEGCHLADNVSVARLEEGANPASVHAPQATEPFIPLITTLFPTLTYLNLSHNMLTSASLTSDFISALVLSSPTRPGLRQLILRGNRIEGLEGFEALANRFKGNRDVPEYKLEELDLRENEIGRLPPILGLLPLDVFLVEGNM
jgi:hypothetical protein